MGVYGAMHLRMVMKHPNGTTYPLITSPKVRCTSLSVFWKCRYLERKGVLYTRCNALLTDF